MIREEPEPGGQKKALKRRCSFPRTTFSIPQTTSSAVKMADGDVAHLVSDADVDRVWSRCSCLGSVNSRNRRRSRTNDTRSRRSSFDTSNSDDGSVISLEFTEQRGDDNDEEFVSHRGDSWARSSHWSSQRRRSRFSDN